MGWNLGYGPETSGSRAKGFGGKPAIYLRYGRFTASTGAGFITRNRDDVVRGFGLDVVEDDRRKVSFSIRMDSGRREASSERLTGLGDVQRTVRLRLGGTWRLDHDVSVGAAWTIDAFGRGGGNIGEFRVAHEYPLGGMTRLLSNASLTVGGPRYMQTYFGITEAQAAASGYPVYDAGFSLTNVGVGVALRTQVARRWSMQIGAGASRLLGDAARSPIVEQPFGWSLNGGLAWHF